MQPAITTVILAGGQGKRIGGAKGLQTLQGRTLIDWVLSTIRSQSKEILINVNNAHEDYARFGYPVIADQISGWVGPLAGLHAAMHCARHDWIACVPCDTPFLPDDLLPRLLAAVSQDATEAAVAVANGKMQPTIGLYHKSLLPSLDAYLRSGGRKVSDWLNTLRLSEVIFDNAKLFININSQQDLLQAGQLMAEPLACMKDATSAMSDTKIIGFAGYSGSGKTTLLEKVIPLLTAQGLRIAVIKHAHHDFDIDKPGKDTFRHRQAGAGEVMIISGHRWALMHELRNEAEPSMEELCARFSPCDLILAEGYKCATIPKLEVFREENRSRSDWKNIYPSDPKIVAVITDCDGSFPLPKLDINKPQEVAAFILKYFSFTPNPQK